MKGTEDNGWYDWLSKSFVKKKKEKELVSLGTSFILLEHWRACYWWFKHSILDCSYDICLVVELWSMTLVCYEELEVNLTFSSLFYD